MPRFYVIVIPSNTHESTTLTAPQPTSEVEDEAKQDKTPKNKHHTQKKIEK